MKDKAAAAEAGAAASEVNEADKETGEKASKLNPGSEKENQLKGFAALEAELKEAAAELQQVGTDTDSFPEIDTEQAKYLFRAKEPRFEDIEGNAGEYSALGEKTSEVIKRGGVEDSAKRRYSFFYENDHIPEKQFAKAILANIDQFKPGGEGEEVDRASEKAEAAPSDKQAASPTIGELGNTIKSIPEDGKGLPAMTIYRPVHMIKKSTPAAKATAMVEAAAQAKGDRVSAVKKLLSDEIKLESDKIVEIVRKDASATDAIRAKIDAGIAAATAENKSLYALDQVEESQKAAAPGAKPDASLSKLPLTGNGADIPNFLEAEGQYMPHENFKPGFGKYMEYDHVIDAAWPRHTKDLRFNHPMLRAKLDARLKGAMPTGMNVRKRGSRSKNSPEDVRNRLSNLGDKKIFSEKQRMWKYETETGPAIALYRPVHRTVTLQLTSPRDNSIPAAAITDQFVEPLAEFILEGDLDELAAARGKAQDDLKRLLVEKTEDHVGHIADQYVHELRAVKKINKKMESAAHQAMVRISATVRDSLVKARSSTEDLFKKSG